jgi:hypothetical protein
VTGGVVASPAWNYPNRNLYNNLDEFDSMTDNYGFLEKAQVRSPLFCSYFSY